MNETARQAAVSGFILLCSNGVRLKSHRTPPADDPCDGAAAFGFYVLMIAACAALAVTPHPVLRASRALRPPPLLSASPAPQGYMDSFPFLCEEECLETMEYRGFGVALSGREAYSAAAASWKSTLPLRLKDFDIRGQTILPPDARSIVSARYTVSFTAPVPPQVLPAQRARVRNANLTRTADGLIPVEARVAATLEIDRETGKVRKMTEELAVDPFAVTATIAHFEYVYARRLVLLQLAQASGDATGTDAGGLGGLTLRARAYWATLRELTRQELSEIVRRQQRESDELRVLDGDAGVSDEQFERWFAGFVVKNFVFGGGFGAVLYFAAKALRDAL